MNAPALTLTVREYLETVGKERLERLYDAMSRGYTREGDEAVAAHLNTGAIADGVQFRGGHRITASTLNRFRSEIELTSKRSPRPGSPPAPAPEPAPAVELQQPELVGFTDAEWRGLVAGFLDEIKTLSSEFRQLRAVIAKRFPELKDERPSPDLRVVVGGAER